MKPKKISKSEKTKQLIKYVFSRTDFNNDMIFWRKRLGIPTQGFRSAEDKDLWLEDLVFRNEEFYEQAWPDFFDSLDSSFVKDFSKLPKLREVQDKISSLSPLGAFNSAIYDLTQKYLLSPKWEQYIRDYLFFNDIEKIELHPGLEIALIRDQRNNPRKITISVLDDTVLSDVKESWAKIKQLQKQLNYKRQEKYQPSINEDIVIHAAKLHHEGKSHKEIAKILNEDWDENCMYFDIPDLLKQYKKKSGINRV